MRFEVEHRFAAPIADVESAMADPAFSEQLRLPGVAPLRVVDRRDDGDVVHLRIAYELTAPLPSVARAVLGAGRLTWIQESDIDRSRHRTDFRIIPDVHAERLSCQGTYQLRADGGGTARLITGDLAVRVPLLAGRAERAIASGLLERLDVEADSLARWLAAAH
ncbi:MAG: hypothetical protein JWO37_2177 [Acidimicrobiales bacterium]|nr:hypothetical protein [Acidimicrobiales bacterium]